MTKLFDDEKELRILLSALFEGFAMKFLKIQSSSKQKFSIKS
jgi:hypothetical protein